MMLNAIRNKVLGGEKITVEEARWLSCQAENRICMMRLMR